MRRAVNPEELIHRLAVAELRSAFRARGLERAPFFHCPNESMVPPQYRAKLRALGLSPGVSDLIIVCPTMHGSPGAALEIKSDKGRATEDQLAWLGRWHAAGFVTAVTKGHTETANTLFRWGYLQQTNVDRWLTKINQMKARAIEAP